MNDTSTNSQTRRTAFTLIELICVLVVLGLMATAVGGMRTNPKLVERLRVKQEGQYLSAALRSARTTAIANGQLVHVDWYKNGNITGFATTIDGAATQPPKHDFPIGMKSDWSSRSVTFRPDGSTDTSLSVALAHPDAACQVDLLSATGQISMTVKE